MSVRQIALNFGINDTEKDLKELCHVFENNTAEKAFKIEV